MQVVVKGTRAENLTGAKPVVLARAGDLSWYLLERTSDSRQFLLVDAGINTLEATRSARLAIAD